MTMGRKLFVANVGDSRGIVIQAAKEEGQCQCQPLTRDHKPDDKDEAERIYKWNGRIDSYRDQQGNPLGPLRVWLKEEDVPGLAMTRSFGDQVAHSVGCNAEPEMNEY
jgi:serine/threonine protein phosphatase PrpC